MGYLNFRQKIMALKATDPIFKAAIEAAKARGTIVGDNQTLADMDAATVVNFDENMWEEGDVFTLPATREELKPFLCTDVLENFPVNPQTGEHPKAHSILVLVKNKKTNKETVKRYRPNAPAISDPLYKWDEAQQTYLAAGGNLASKTALAQAISLLPNQGARIDYVLGKTIEVKHILSGDVARRQGGVITGIRRRYIPEMDIVSQ